MRKIKKTKESGEKFIVTYKPRSWFIGNSCFHMWGWLFLMVFCKEVLFYFLFIVDSLRSDDSYIQSGIVQPYQRLHLFFAGIREDKDAMLKLFEPDGFQMITENVAENTLLFRNIEHNDPP